MLRKEKMTLSGADAASLWVRLRRAAAWEPNGKAKTAMWVVLVMPVGLIKQRAAYIIHSDYNLDITNQIKRQTMYYI